MKEQQVHQIPPVKRRRGAPKGNQNARKHGYYSDVLGQEQRAALARLPVAERIDARLQLLKVKAASIIQHNPRNTRLIRHVAAKIAKLQHARKILERLSKDEVFRERVKEAFRKDGFSIYFYTVTPDGKTIIL